MRFKQIITIWVMVLATAIFAFSFTTVKGAVCSEKDVWTSIPSEYVVSLKVYSYKEEFLYEIQLVLVNKTTVNEQIASLLRSLLRPEDRDKPFFFVRLYKPKGAQGAKRPRIREDDFHLMIGERLYNFEGEFYQLGERNAFGYNTPALTAANPSELAVWIPSERIARKLRKAKREGKTVQIYYEEGKGVELKLPGEI